MRNFCTECEIKEVDGFMTTVKCCGGHRKNNRTGKVWFNSRWITLEQVEKRREADRSRVRSEASKERKRKNDRDKYRNNKDFRAKNSERGKKRYIANKEEINKARIKNKQAEGPVGRAKQSIWSKRHYYKSDLKSKPWIALKLLNDKLELDLISNEEYDKEYKIIYDDIINNRLK